MIRLAIQSKGRLNEDSLRLLQDIGVRVDDAKRKFLGKADSFPLEVLYLRDDDIPGVVCDGASDIGIVGLNEVRETGADISIKRRRGHPERNAGNRRAGCGRLVLCTPPPVSPSILFTAGLCGIREVFAVGGVQAIAAMAYAITCSCSTI